MHTLYRLCRTIPYQEFLPFPAHGQTRHTLTLHARTGDMCWLSFLHLPEEVQGEEP